MSQKAAIETQTPHPLSEQIIGLEPALGGGGECFLPPCCNSFVFEVMRPKFCIGIRYVKICQGNDNESHCFNYDVIMPSFLKCASRQASFLLFVIFHLIKIRIGTGGNQIVLIPNVRSKM